MAFSFLAASVTAATTYVANKFMTTGPEENNKTDVRDRGKGQKKPGQSKEGEKTDSDNPNGKKTINMGYVKYMLRPSTFKHLITFSKGSHAALIVFNILSFSSTYISSTLPMYSSQCLDLLKEKDGHTKLYEKSKEFLIMSCLYVVLSFLISFVSTRIQQRVSVSVQKYLFNEILSKDLDFFENKNTQGDLFQNIYHNFSTVIHHSTFKPYINFVQNLFKLTVVVSILWSTSPRLSLCIFVAMPLVSFATKYFSNYSSKVANMSQRRGANRHNIIAESITNIRLVKSFSTEDKSLEELSNNLEESSRKNTEAALIGSILSAIISLSEIIGNIAVLVLGGQMVMEGTLTIGELTMFTIYSKTFAGQTRNFSNFFMSLSNAGLEVSKVIDLLEYIPKVNATGGLKPEKFEGHVEFRNVTFCYPARPDVEVLKNISLTIQPGDVVAFVGQSGSGKSSTIGLLNRFYDPTKGGLLIDGKDLKTLDLKWFHQNVGYVAQEPSLMSGSIEQNIAYGVKNYTPEQLKLAIEQANVKEIVENKDLFPKGLATEVGERGVKLSGGQKQRVAIARALIKDPKILIFDEATSALDSESEYQVQKAIDGLMREGKRTVVIIAHRLSTIINCNKIYVMKNGEIKEVGTHQELMAKGGVYKDLFERQVTGYDEPKNTKENGDSERKFVKKDHDGSERRFHKREDNDGSEMRFNKRDNDGSEVRFRKNK